MIGMASVPRLVVTVKVADDFPAPTVTLEGTVADELLLASAMVMLPVAGPLSVTVPVEEPPARTINGFSHTPVSVTGGGVTVRGAVFVTLL